jgi:hypothetical protein
MTDDGESSTVLLPGWERLAPPAILDRSWKRYYALPRDGFVPLSASISTA